jgi:hypothetical protein
MPQELIYTSATRGLKTGSSGFCTVAMTEGMPEALVSRLEQLSYYRHERDTEKSAHPIFCFRHVEARGQRYRVLTRLADTGADFTGRTNFLAHHLVFRPEEAVALSSKTTHGKLPIPSPAELALFWPGWRTSWSEESRLLEPIRLESFRGVHQPMLPCEEWKRLTGHARQAWNLLDPANVSGLLDPGELEEGRLLRLIAESLQLLEECEPAKWWHGSAWNCTFTTMLQEGDDAADFLWRFVRPNLTAAQRDRICGGRDVRKLKELLESQRSEEETAFAELGIEELQAWICKYKKSCDAGSRARLDVKASGRPSAKTVRWFDEAGQLLGAEAAIDLPVRMGENCWRCEVSNFRQTWEQEIKIEGRLPGNMTTTTASWTPTEKEQFAKKLVELSTKNPGIYETSLSAGVLDVEPLDRVWLESRVTDGTLSREQLAACFKALFYCGEQKKQLVVKEVLDKFETLRKKPTSPLLHVVGAFLLTMTIALVVWQWESIRAAFKGSGDADAVASGTNTEPETVSDEPSEPATNHVAAVAPSSGHLPGPRNSVLTKAEFTSLSMGGWSYRFNTNRADSDGLLPDALVEVVRPIELTKRGDPSRNPWDIKKSDNVIRLAPKPNNPSVRPPQMLVMQDDKIRLYALFAKVDGVELRFRLVDPRADPADEHTRVWMSMLATFYDSGRVPGMMRVGKGEDEELRAVAEIPIRLKEGLQGDLAKLNEDVRFYTRKYDLLDVAGGMWGLLKPGDVDDAVMIDVLGGHPELWSKYGKTSMKRRECEQLASDLYVILRYLERPRQGRPRIEEFQRHDQATRMQWVRIEGKMPPKRRYAEELLRLWREVENLGRYRYPSQLGAYLADWSVGSENLLALRAKTPAGEIELGGADKSPFNNNIRFGEFRREAGEMKKNIGPSAARISGVVTLPDIGKFNLLLESR